MQVWDDAVRTVTDRVLDLDVAGRRVTEEGAIVDERADHVEDQMALGRRHAGGRLVEQQHARVLCQRDRDLDQALAAIGQLAHDLERIVGETQRLKDQLDKARLQPPGARGWFESDNDED